ncbi:PIN domain-containing protein [Actinomycetota bacterium]
MNARPRKKIIVDTSIWIEFLKKNPKIFPSMQVLLEKNNAIALGCIFGELLQGAKSERERKIILSYWQYLPKIDNTGIWIDAGIYSGNNKFISKGIGLIDSLIITAAINNGLIVWTLDKKLQSVMTDELRY